METSEQANKQTNKQKQNSCCFFDVFPTIIFDQVYNFIVWVFLHTTGGKSQKPNSKWNANNSHNRSFRKKNAPPPPPPIHKHPTLYR